MSFAIAGTVLKQLNFSQLRINTFRFRSLQDLGPQTNDLVIDDYQLPLAKSNRQLKISSVHGAKSFIKFACGKVIHQIVKNLPLTTKIFSLRRKNTFVIERNLAFCYRQLTFSCLFR